jgi:hypothetical protein
MVRPEPTPPRPPWLIPTIVVVASIVIVVGLIVAVAAGGRIF